MGYTLSSKHIDTVSGRMEAFMSQAKTDHKGTFDMNIEQKAVRKPVNQALHGGQPVERTGVQAAGRRRIFFALLLMLCLILTGCGGGNLSDAAQEPASNEAFGAEIPSLLDTSSAPVEGQDETRTPAAVQTAMVYIGTRAEGFAEYPITYEGELTPETLIQGIADLTGWDMSLEESVVSGKGGMSVCFSENSALFVGPPEPQKEEFFMFGADQQAETLLDSVQKTLQEGFTLEGGDPDLLDIWYSLKDSQPLSLPNLGLSWAIDQPYQWTSAIRES